MPLVTLHFAIFVGNNIFIYLTIIFAPYCYFFLFVHYYCFCSMYDFLVYFVEFSNICINFYECMVE